MVKTGSRDTLGPLGGLSPAPLYKYSSSFLCENTMAHFYHHSVHQAITTTRKSTYSLHFWVLSGLPFLCHIEAADGSTTSSECSLAGGLVHRCAVVATSQCTTVSCNSANGLLNFNRGKGGENFTGPPSRAQKMAHASVCIGRKGVGGHGACTF